ncbi:cupin-like domain-containing protein [Paucibacter sp. DJ1R-11]|uniref:cupin-like domain-containing protein n=1 Tax=Paucibacter sp. DJ1R-11 TaxID=2893556 RepID=UPI0021E4DE24|nr:cupin-like domain-containing protein [Paucibacter sp. DJ1R-11]MCV2365141.1 cupin-like domain-containing protein [Paucibacter sp. DJ1R-11]
MSALPAELRQWLATNLLRGCTPQSIEAGLIAAGIEAEQAAREIQQATHHPYLLAAAGLQNKLARRESLLKTLDWQLRRTPAYAPLQRQPLPPYSQFLQDFYYTNRPGLFSGAVDHWPALQWTPRSLAEKAGLDTRVQVQWGRESDPDYELRSPSHRQEMDLGALVDLIETAGSSNDFYLTAGNRALAREGMARLLEDIGSLGDGYLHPERPKQEMHLWLGPSGVRTPLHHDLTNNLFVQLHGEKRFLMVPALQAPYLCNEVHVFSPVDLSALTSEHRAQLSVLDVRIEPGDLLFIPAGWWHQVEGLSASISLSFTQINLPFNGFIDFP